MKDAEFTWDAPAPAVVSKKEKGSKGKDSKGKDKKASGAPVAAEPTKAESDKIFHLQQTNISVPRGKLVAIVGSVGSGKSSLLQGLIGEMRKTAGSVKFGGSVAYCPQVAWIQVSSALLRIPCTNVLLKNATIRDNICFGRPFEAEKYWQAVQDSCLESDLALLPYGDMTEVGERVSNLHSRCRRFSCFIGYLPFRRSETEGQHLPSHLLRLRYPDFRRKFL